MTKANQPATEFSVGDTLSVFLRTLPAESLDELPQSVNLNEIVQDVLQLSTDKRLAAGVVVSWTPQAVTGFSRALRALFMNLIDNAIQAMKGGAGQVSRQSSDRVAEVQVSTHGSSDRVAVEVSDNGAGLTEDARFAAFEPLYCGWRNKRGHAGMGLSMARDIAGRHAGEIDIDRSHGGVRVTVTFPLQTAEAHE